MKEGVHTWVIKIEMIKKKEDEEKKEDQPANIPIPNVNNPPVNVEKKYIISYFQKIFFFLMKFIFLVWNGNGIR